MDREFERKRVETEQESRRLKRVGSMKREDDAFRQILEQEEEKRREILEKRSDDEKRRRQKERDRLEEERLQRLKVEEEAWAKVPEPARPPADVLTTARRRIATSERRSEP